MLIMTNVWIVIKREFSEKKRPAPLYVVIVILKSCNLRNQISGH